MQRNTLILVGALALVPGIAASLTTGVASAAPRGAAGVERPHAPTSKHAPAPRAHAPRTQAPAPKKWGGARRLGVTFVLADPTLTVGEQAVFRGTVSPYMPGTRVVLQGQFDGRWRPIATASVKGSGAFTRVVSAERLLKASAVRAFATSGNRKWYADAASRAVPIVVTPAPTTAPTLPPPSESPAPIPTPTPTPSTDTPDPSPSSTGDAA